MFHSQINIDKLEVVQMTDFGGSRDSHFVIILSMHGRVGISICCVEGEDLLVCAPGSSTWSIPETRHQIVEVTGCLGF